TRPLPLVSPTAPRWSHAPRGSAPRRRGRGGSLPGPPVPGARLRRDVGLRLGDAGRVLRRPDVDHLVAPVLEQREANGLADPPLDLLRHVGVLRQELPGVLPALPELLALVREPRARLLDDLEVDADVEERALLGDPLAVHDVELALAERRRDLVLHDLDPGPRADH